MLAIFTLPVSSALNAAQVNECEMVWFPEVFIFEVGWRHAISEISKGNWPLGSQKQVFVLVQIQIHIPVLITVAAATTK